MTVDPQTYKRVMSQWASGVSVVTSHLDGKWLGLTVSSFCSVSLEPPLVSVCIGKKLHSHRVISQSRVYAVNILSGDHVYWGKLFAGFFPEIENRFSGITCQTAVTGCPILPDILGWVDCRVYHAYDAGDHTIFVGEVIAADSASADLTPLVYHRRQWGQFQKLEDKN